jgi:dolichyl-diphosphooligosaccharide--protein glycosyltransferase
VNTDSLRERARRGCNRYALVAALVLVAVVRLLPATDVYQAGTVVLSGNDPYAYRHATEAMIHGPATPWSLPDGVANGEPLLVSTLWIGSLLLGGSQWATDTVVAWYPVVTAVVSGVLVYAIATRASGDSRIGLAAVVLLAVTPVHGFRTSLGFADHHAFDYLWLALTTFALIALLEPDRRELAPWHVALLGVGIAGQLLAWEAGPLLVVPLAIAIAVSAFAFLDATDLTPLRSVVIGLGLGAGLVAFARYSVGWHSRVTVVVAGTLFVGAIGVYALTWWCRIRGRSWPTLLALELSAIVLTSIAVTAFTPETVDQLLQGIDRLLTRTRIGETSSLTADYGPVLGPLVLLGFAPFLALPAVVIGLHIAKSTVRPAWPILIVYAGYFTVLAGAQRRFGGELAIFAAVLGGLGLIRILAWLDIVREVEYSIDSPPEPPLVVPDRTRLALLGGVVSVFTGTGALYTTLINSRVGTDSRAVRAAQWMAEYAERREWTYPENFVMSDWGQNRMFNYFVNGRSASYGFARRYYESFLFTSDAAGWYDRFVDRVRFIVVRDYEHVDTTNPFLLYARLRNLGSATDRAPGLGHYRAVYTTPDREYIVFTLVSGATVSGNVDSGTRLVANVSIPGAEFEYVRTIDSSEDGSFEVRVAHPGTYQIGDRRVEVSERAVRSGKTVQIP